MFGARRILWLDGAGAPDWRFGLAGSAATLGVLSLTPGRMLPLAAAALVALVGMPHGGLDFRLGRNLFAARTGRWGTAAFLGSYLTVMAAMLAGWAWAPLPTVAVFVLLSAAHFGEVELRSAGRARQLADLIRGGMVVWLPALFRPAEFTQLLVWIMPNGRWPEGLLFDPLVRAALCAALACLFVAMLGAPAEEGLATLGLAGLCALAPPLTSFAVYFCGWHSVVELVRLARQAAPHNGPLGLRRVAAAAALPTALAVALAALGWRWATADQPPNPALVRSTFIGLSVVAVPHMLLHWLAARRQVTPFDAAREANPLPHPIDLGRRRRALSPTRSFGPNPGTRIAMNAIAARGRDALSSALFGMSLTALMAATLFATVGLNPKAAAYGAMPWRYAAGSLLAAAALHLGNRRVDRPHVEEIAK